MSGIYLIFLVSVWILTVAVLAYRVTSRLKNLGARIVVMLALVGALLPLPLADELLGRRQFEELCRTHAVITLSRASVSSATVYFASQPNVVAEGTWIPIVIRPQTYVDSVTGEVVASLKTLTASGGVLARALGLSEARVPLTFVGTCGPRQNINDLFEPPRVSRRLVGVSHAGAADSAS